MTDTKLPHQDYEGIREQIKADYSNLSKRLQQIAKFALDHPTDMAIETIATIAQRAQVQPSALIRFSKAFGYNGFSAMQRAFQSRVHERSASYKERVRDLESDLNGNTQGLVSTLTQQFCNTGRFSLEELQETLDVGAVERALTLLENADRIYICAQRRSFPVAAYLAYSLNHADASAILLDGVGGMLKEQVHNIRPNEVLVAITYPPYAPETSATIDIAVSNQVPVLIITDSSLCPHADVADVCLEVKDAEVHSFKSLTASMCLSQVLVTSLAFRNRDKSVKS